MPSIHWADHVVHVRRLVGEMYKNSELTDGVVDTNGGLIYVHKTIVAACSPYLKKLFKEQNGMKIFSLKEVEFNDMKLILDFIYFGEIDVPVTRMVSVRRAAELLQISSLQSASVNFSNAFSIMDASEESVGDSCKRCEVNCMKHAEKEIYGEVSRLIGSQRLHEDTESGFSAKCQIIDLQPVCGPGTKLVPKIENKELVEDEPVLSFTRTGVMQMDTLSNDSENFQDEIPPVYFVAVSPGLVKREDLDDLPCDSLLQNPLEVHTDDSDAMKVYKVEEEADCKSESQIKMEVKTENEVSELGLKMADNDSDLQAMAKVSCSGDVPSGDELSTNVEGNFSMFLGHVGGVRNNQNEKRFRRTVNDSSSRREDFEVEFELICEPDLKEQKLRQTAQDNDEFSSQKEVNEDSSFINFTQDVNDGLDIATRRMLRLKKPVIVLQRIQLPYQFEGDANKSDCNKACGSPMSQTFQPGLEEKFKKCSGDEESFNSLHSDAVFNTKVECNGHSTSNTVEEVSFVSHKTHLKDYGQVPTSAKIFVCVKCNSLFSQRVYLKRHMQTHVGEKLFICAECDTPFKWKSKLKRHMRIHTGGKTFKCAVCDTSLKWKGDLKRHMRIHTGEKPFKCYLCDTLFRRKFYLKQHMYIHTGEKPFKCEVCDTSFRHLSHLKDHMRTHTGEKPYKCVVCHTSFRWKGLLKDHMRTHTGEKPYKCVVCDTSFRWKRLLKYHMRTHTAEKPYKCVVCDTSFRWKGDLKKHLRIHTGEKVI